MTQLEAQTENAPDIEDVRASAQALAQNRVLRAGAALAPSIGGAPGSPERGAMLNAVREKLLPSVFMIKIYGKINGDIPDPETGAQTAWKAFGHGSGSVVKVEKDPASGKRVAYMLTNRHVVSHPDLENLEEKIDTLIKVVLPSGKERAVIDSYQDGSSYFRDMALIKVLLEDEDEVPVPITIDAAPVMKVGKTIVVAGFPGNQVELVTSSGEIARPLPTRTDDKDNYHVSMTKGFAANIRENPGDSGGVITDTEGRVIALAGHNDNANNGTGRLPVMIPASEFLAMASHPEIFIAVQKLFNEEGGRRDEQGDGALLPLEKRFRVILKGIEVSIKNLTPEEIRAIMDDPGMRAMFRELLKHVRSEETKKRFNRQFMEIFDRHKVSPLF